MVRAGGVAECGADAAIFLRDQLIVRELFIRRVPGAAHIAMDFFCKRFGQTIGERFRHDRVVIVVIALEMRDELVDADACRHRERADVIEIGRDEIGEREVFSGVRLLLLSQRVKFAAGIE